MRPFDFLLLVGSTPGMGKNTNHAYKKNKIKMVILQYFMALPSLTTHTQKKKEIKRKNHSTSDEMILLKMERKV